MPTKEPGGTCSSRCEDRCGPQARGAQLNLRPPLRARRRKPCAVVVPARPGRLLVVGAWLADVRTARAIWLRAQSDATAPGFPSRDRERMLLARSAQRSRRIEVFGFGAALVCETVIHPRIVARRQAHDASPTASSGREDSPGHARGRQVTRASCVCSKSPPKYSRCDTMAPFDFGARPDSSVKVAGATLGATD